MVTLRAADGEIVHFQADESVRNPPRVRISVKTPTK